MNPLKVGGSGSAYEIGFWLNVRDIPTQGLKKGKMSVAINNWLDYFAVRCISA